MTDLIRRVVTTHIPTGRATFLSDDHTGADAVIWAAEEQRERV
jgi:hypothetical protein